MKHHINSRSETNEQTLAKHMMKSIKTIQNKLAQKRKHKFPQAKHGQREIVELKTQHKNPINSEKSRGKTITTGKKEFKTEKPYLLVDDFELKRVNQWRSKMEARCEWTRTNEKDNEQSQKDRGKNKKFKNCPCISKTRDFRD